MIKDHTHLGLSGDGQRISWNNIKNKQGRPAFGDYILKTNVEGSGDIEIETGFKPKVVYIYSFYPGRAAVCESWTVEEEDGSLTTSTGYNPDDIRKYDSFPTGDSSVTPCIYVFRDTSRRQILYMKSFNGNGFTLRYGINGLNDVGIIIVAKG